jgi:uncharacterized protein YoxC
MWDKIIEFGKELLALKGQVSSNTSDIKELQKDLKDLTSAVRDLSFSVQRLTDSIDHNKELEKSERDKLTWQWQSERDRLIAQLQNALLKMENRYLSSGNSTKRSIQSDDSGLP